MAKQTPVELAFLALMEAQTMLQLMGDNGRAIDPAKAIALAGQIKDAAASIQSAIKAARSALDGNH